MDTETFIIVNPTAGDGQAEKRWQDFENDLKKNHIHYHDVITEYKNHATELISEAVSSGYNRIGVFGGDGTLNEALQGMFKEDNIISEAIGIIQYESMKKFGNDKIIEINVTDKNVKSLVKELILIINYKQKIIQKIDWLNIMTSEKMLRKYLK